MKRKMISLALTFVMIFSLMPTLVFAEANTQISSVDLAGLGLGKGWAGKTVSDVGAEIAGYPGYAARNVSFVTALFADSELQFLSDTDSFAAGNSYMIQIVLKANDGYYFANDKNDCEGGANYTGTADPKPVMSAVGSYIDDEGIGHPVDATPDQMIYVNLVYQIKVSGGQGSPDTGDNGRLLSWAALLAVSGTVLTGAVICGRKKKDND